jgi:glycosyltransferase involved in cell wall biosynthesis
MALFSIPGWIKPHLYTNKQFADLTEAELDDLKQRLEKFKSDQPDVSVMIPAWNEENNIYRALSSLAANITSLKVEIVVINNNSTDRTQQVLDRLGVRSYLQPIQGTPHARQLGLMKAKGKYHLCADSDSFYPPRWIELMTKPLQKNDKVVGVYGRYSFVPPPGSSRLLLFAYEKVTGLLIRIRKYNREYINVLGFNMGFITKAGRDHGGFEVTEVRKFDNALGSEYFVEEAEDGRMAVNLMKTGTLKLVTHPAARVFTSSRRLIAEGGILKSFTNRAKLHTNKMSEYVGGKKD